MSAQDPAGGSAPSPMLEVAGITKSFGLTTVLRDISFIVAGGEIRALLGENGAGKSTLIKIITGALQADQGTIAVDGFDRRIKSPSDAQGCGIAVVSQELSLAPNLSVLDNIWLGNAETPFFHRRKTLRQRASDALAKVGLTDSHLEARVSSLGVGQRQLVEIARMLTRNARVLILDEPTATLSDLEIGHVFQALRSLKAEGHAIIYITHRLGEVFQICDSVSVLRNGEHVGTNETTSINRAALVSMMLGRELATLYPPARQASDNDAFVVRGLSLPPLVQGLDFAAGGGSVTCLAGQVGSGATEVLRALAGLDPGATGGVSVRGVGYALRSVHRARARRVFFVSEDRAGEGIFTKLNVAENLLACQLKRFSHFGFLALSSMRRVARDMAESVSVDARRLKSDAADLSGGNQQKLAFARLIEQGSPGVLLLNEPTRGVDVGARADIYKLIRRFCDEGWCVILASSDMEEVLGLGDKIIALYRGQVASVYPRSETNEDRVLSDITHARNAA